MSSYLKSLRGDLEASRLLKKQSISFEPVPVRRHTQAADQQAFDDLYIRMQEIEEITNRAIREGQRGHKSALVKIRAICQRVE